MAAERRAHAGWRRTVFGGLVLVSTLAATTTLAGIMGSDGIAWMDVLLLVLFAVLFLWICASFWTAVLGFFSCLWTGLRVWPRATGRGRPGTARAPRSVTAIIVPICNEEVPRVFARIRAIHDSLRTTAIRDHFHIHALSDTTDPEIWIQEEIAWGALCRRVSGWGRIFYRHRLHNTGYKCGNIADFCRRWGRHYDYMVVLDADSLMSGPVIEELVRRMDANPRAGLIQTPPGLVNGETLFARLQQFAASLYGPMFAMGAAFWQLGESNYWGHNAIIRVAAFMRHCGLPPLPGRRPLGGLILSHDFVEAALLRRAGWEVWLAPDLDVGSFEEPPPTLAAYAKRDFRWCQGNLQHVRLLCTQGFHGLSRLHLAMGAMTYLMSPLWLLFLIISMVEAWRRVSVPHEYFVERSLFPSWPISYAGEALTLLGITLALLFLPKVLALILLFRDRARLAAFGGTARTLAGVLIESLLSAFIAPILMAFHARFVASTLLGRDTGWTPQERAGNRPRLADFAVIHAEHMAAGLIATAAAFYFVPHMIWWLAPVLVGPVLAVPLALLLASPELGRLARRWGIFLVPTEATPSPLLRGFGQALGETAPQRAGEGPAIERVVRDPSLNALHVLLLAPRGLPAPRPHMETLVRRVNRSGMPALSPGEQKELLSCPGSMMRLHALASRKAPVSAAFGA